VGADQLNYLAQRFAVASSGAPVELRDLPVPLLMLALVAGLIVPLRLRRTTIEHVSPPAFATGA
jgi:hypothetical protein